MKGNDELMDIDGNPKESIEELKIASFKLGMGKGLLIGFIFGLAVAALVFDGVFR